MDRLTNDVIRTGKKVINKNLKLVINTEFDILKDKIREKIIKDYVSISKKGVEEILEKTADSWKNEWFSKDKSIYALTIYNYLGLRNKAIKLKRSMHQYDMDIK